MLVLSFVLLKNVEPSHQLWNDSICFSWNLKRFHFYAVNKQMYRRFNHLSPRYLCSSYFTPLSQVQQMLRKVTVLLVLLYYLYSAPLWPITVNISSQKAQYGILGLSLSNCFKLSFGINSKKLFIIIDRKAVFNVRKWFRIIVLWLWTAVHIHYILLYEMD